MQEDGALLDMWVYVHIGGIMGREITGFIVLIITLGLLGFSILAWPNDLNEAEQKYYDSKSRCEDYSWKI